MSVMHKSLQKHVISQLLEKHGINADTVDIEAEIDSSLSLRENLEPLSEKLGIPLTNELEQIKHDKYEWLERNSNELLEEYLNMFGEIDSDIESDSENDENDFEENFEEKILDELTAHQTQMHEYFSEIVKNYDPLEYFSKYIAPELKGKQYNEIKKTLLLLLASQYDSRKRTRIHILLQGAKGTGKSELLLWMRDKLFAKFANAQYTSQVGLIGDASGKELTPGLLSEAHGNILCIDELDKVKKREDLEGLLQAMEEGQYNVTKGKIREVVKSEVRIIAAANEMDKFPEPLLDRFDFIFTLKVPTREERTKNVKNLVSSFFGKIKTPDVTVLKEFLNWIKDFEPLPTDLDKISKVIESYIKLTNANIDELSYRSLELSILRIAYAYAKLKRSNITPKDVVKAITIKDKTLTKEQIRYLCVIADGKI